MPRMEPLNAPYEPAVQDSFDAIMPFGAPPLLLFRTLARSNRAWRKFRAGSLLADSPLTLREREIAINRTCFRSGCEYEWGVHVAVFASAAGLTLAEIERLAQLPANLDEWAPREAALVATVDALHDRVRLTNDEFNSLSAHYAEDQVLEILMLAGFYRTVAYVANGLALPAEPGTPTLPN